MAARTGSGYAAAPPAGASGCGVAALAAATLGSDSGMVAGSGMAAGSGMGAGASICG